MKVVKTILFYLGVIFVSLVAILFAFVELRSLFAGDFILTNGVIVGFISYLYRGIYFLSILALAIFLVIYRKRKKKVDIVLFSVSIALLIGAIISFNFYDYFITLAIIFIDLILLLMTFLGYFKKERGEE